jgi:MYXO-CTERM domain-containing protein
MGRVIGGVVMLALGGLWIGQGVGAVHGSFMTGHAIWAIIGAVVGLFGLALLAGARRRSRPGDR